MELHPKQFKNYQPAAKEGKAASNWLSTDEGHDWQDKMPRVSYQDYHPEHNESVGLYSVKEDHSDEHERMWTRTSRSAWNSASLGRGPRGAENWRRGRWRTRDPRTATTESGYQWED